MTDPEPPCVVCENPVTGRRQALECDGCGAWQHRLCDTGISQDTYRQLNREEIELDFFCRNCERNGPPPLVELFPPAAPDESFQTQGTDESFQEQDIDGSLQEQDIDGSLQEQDIDGSLQAQGIDGSFHFQADGSFVVPDPNRNVEDAVGDISVEDNLPEDEGGEVTFELIDAGTKKARSMLADSNGYSYTHKETRPYAIYWTCSRRKTGDKCPATVIERAGVYRRGNNRHHHPPEMHAATNLRIKAKVRKMAVRNLFRSANSIVEEVVMEEVDVRAPNPDLPSIANMVRMANKRRQELRPKDPTTLEFDLEEQHLPDGFLKADIQSDGHRMLVFATDQQLKLLSRAKTWYMDATFKVVGRPFYQLFGIHAFVREDQENEKQVPLALVFMSHKDKKDYKKVLKKIVRLLPGDREPKVTTFVMDFEQGMWQAVRSVFPGKTRRGCAFHWTQAVYRKIQELGLQEAYRRREGAHRLLRNFMGLLMLPHEHVRPTFDALCEEAANDARLDRLTSYMRTYWMESTVWEVSEWVVFMEPVRTNNDTEGWHRRLKQKANQRVHLPLYLLVNLLKREADFVSLQVQQVSFKKLGKYQRERERTTQGKLFKYWQEYKDKVRSTSSLLRACSRVYAPIPEE
ncbi:uncharacterized protein LOC118425699 [Branchiostoma floridae]|uniref:Uncharacterized protein LOC118425699 n=1 Tax=Branchiostoma floridae TaxID=7739 RepID=A0A9J7N2G5_BRAFL|nr:uncharacterized protein LOC118425699 [Branchiostoma floridae]